SPSQDHSSRCTIQGRRGTDSAAQSATDRQTVATLASACHVVEDFHDEMCRRSATSRFRAGNITAVSVFGFDECRSGFRTSGRKEGESDFGGQGSPDQRWCRHQHSLFPLRGREKRSCRGAAAWCEGKPPRLAHGYGKHPGIRPCTAIE